MSKGLVSDFQENGSNPEELATSEIVKAAEEARKYIRIHKPEIRMNDTLNSLKDRYNKFTEELTEKFIDDEIMKDPKNKLFLSKIFGDSSLKDYDGTNAKETHNVKTIDNIISSLFYDFAESSYIEIEDYDISTVVSVTAIKNGEVDKNTHGS